MQKRYGSGDRDVRCSGVAREVVDQFRNAISAASAQRIAEDQERITDDEKKAVRDALLQEMTNEAGGGHVPEEESFVSHEDMAQIKRDLAEARAAQQSAEQEMWHLGEQLEASLLVLERDGIAPPPSVAAQVESNARVASAESRVVALQGQVMAMQSQVLAMQREKHEAQAGFNELEVVHQATLRENRDYRQTHTTKTRTADKDAARGAAMEAAVKQLRAVLVGMSCSVAARSVANWQMNMAKDVVWIMQATPSIILCASTRCVVAACADAAVVRYLWRKRCPSETRHWLCEMQRLPVVPPCKMSFRPSGHVATACCRPLLRQSAWRWSSRMPRRGSDRWKGRRRYSSGRSRCSLQTPCWR